MCSTYFLINYLFKLIIVRQFGCLFVNLSFFCSSELIRSINS